MVFSGSDCDLISPGRRNGVVCFSRLVTLSGRVKANRVVVSLRRSESMPRMYEVERD